MRYKVMNCSNPVLMWHLKGILDILICTCEFPISNFSDQRRRKIDFFHQTSLCAIGFRRGIHSITQILAEIKWLNGIMKFVVLVQLKFSIKKRHDGVP